MAFTKQPPRTATAIGRITTILVDNPANQQLRFVLTVLDQHNEPMQILRGDVSEHLTAGQINTLETFMTTQRGKLASAEPALGVVYHVLNDADGAPGNQAVRYVGQKTDGTNASRGDEAQHMTGGQTNALRGFMNAIRSKAQTEIL